MDRNSVDSSNIESIGYDETSSTLEIEFKSGGVWQYYDVPEATWYEFEGAPSKGKFFHKEIKGKFTESRV